MEKRIHTVPFIFSVNPFTIITSCIFSIIICVRMRCMHNSTAQTPGASEPSLFLQLLYFLKDHIIQHLDICAFHTRGAGFNNARTFKFAQGIDDD